MTVAYSELLDLIWIAPVAVLVVSITFSLALLGATRAGEQRRAGSPAAALGFSALALIAGLAFAGLVVAAVGLIVAG